MTESPHSRRMVRGNWYWTDKAIIRQYARKVGAVGIAVYDCLASFANIEQTCYPSQQYIGDILGYSRTTVNRAIKTLEHHGLIAIEKRGYSEIKGGQQFWQYGRFDGGAGTVAWGGLTSRLVNYLSPQGMPQACSADQQKVSSSQLEHE